MEYRARLFIYRIQLVYFGCFAYQMRKSLSYSTLISMSVCWPEGSLGGKLRTGRKSVVSCYLVSLELAELFQATYFTLMVVIRLSILESPLLETTTL